MTAETPVPAQHRPIAWWLGPTGVLAVLAIGILWSLPRPMPMCPAIYPAPPECFVGDSSGVLPFLVLIVLIYAAIVTCALLVPAHRRTLVLVLLTAALALLTLVGIATTLAAAPPGPIYY